jgi:hypothetical protein
VWRLVDSLSWKFGMNSLPKSLHRLTSRIFLVERQAGTGPVKSCVVSSGRVPGPSPFSPTFLIQPPPHPSFPPLSHDLLLLCFSQFFGFMTLHFSANEVINFYEKRRIPRPRTGTASVIKMLSGKEGG